jgi:hypothetical protein
MSYSKTSKAIRTAEVIADLIRNGRPRPEIKMVICRPCQHLIGPYSIELQMCYAETDDRYCKYVTELVYRFYCVTYGGPHVDLDHDAARQFYDDNFTL